MIHEDITLGPVRLIRGDCTLISPTLEGVDAVITDPPFESEAHTLKRRINRGTTRGGDGDAVAVESLGFAAIQESEQTGICEWAGKNVSGWFLAFCQAEAVSSWRSAMELGGVRYKRAMVWIKPDGMPQYSGDRPGMGYESIAAGWCGSGKSKWNGGGSHGVFTYTKNSGGKHDHPTQKPLPLMERLVCLFTDQGQTLLDPFMGSGTTLIAAIRTGRRAIGIEIDERHFRTAVERVKRELAQPMLPAMAPQKVEQQDLIA